MILMGLLLHVHGLPQGGGGGGQGGGGAGADCGIECLKEVIPGEILNPNVFDESSILILGEPKQDYPIYGQSFLCKLNPKNPGCPGWGK